MSAKNNCFALRKRIFHPAHLVFKENFRFQGVGLPSDEST
jgi:hypothetical protein